MLHNHKNQAY